jgi:hypothetical protein
MNSKQAKEISDYNRGCFTLLDIINKKIEDAANYGYYLVLIFRREMDENCIEDIVERGFEVIECDEGYIVTWKN